MPSSWRIAPSRSSTSSSSSPSTLSKRPTSSRNSRSPAGRWDHSRDSIQPATMSPDEASLSGRGAVTAVAVHAHGDRPAGGLRGHRGKAPARQREIEEAGDLGRREAQILREQHLRARVEDGGGNIEPRRQFPTGQRQVQVGRRGRHQVADERCGGGVGEPLEFVDCEHARGAVVRDGAQHQGGALVRGEAGRGGAARRPRAARRPAGRRRDRRRARRARRCRPGAATRSVRHARRVLGSRPPAASTCRIRRAPATSSSADRSACSARRAPDGGR